MANTTRFNPFILSTLDSMEDLVKQVFKPSNLEAVTKAPIRISVKEGENAYEVTAELPGVNKEDIHVDVENNQVSISAEVRQTKEVKEGERFVWTERYFGKLFRTFAVVDDIDEANVKAKFDNGVLELVLPKKTVKAVSKKIVID